MSIPTSDASSQVNTNPGAPMGSRASYQVPMAVSNGSAIVPVPSSSGSARAGSNVASFDVLSLLKALRRRWALALMLGLVLGSLVGGIAWFVLPSAKYTATAVLQVMQHTPIVIFDDHQKEPEFKVFQKTQIAFLQSDRVLKAALRDPKVAQLPTVREHAESDQIEWMKEQLKLTFNENSEVLLLSMQGDRPADLEVIVNAVVDAYMTKVVADERQKRNDRLDKLRKLWDGYQSDLKARRLSLKALGEAAGSTDKDTLAFMQQDTIYAMQQARMRRLAYIEDIRKLNMEIKSLEAVQAAVDPNAPKQPGGDQPVELALKAYQNEMERDPSYQKLDQEVRAAEAKITRIRGNVRSKSDPAILAAIHQRDLAREARENYKNQHMEARRQGLTMAAGGTAAPGTMSDAYKLVQLRAQLKYVEQSRDEIDKSIADLNAEAKRLNSSTLDVTQEQEEMALAVETSRKVGAEIESIEVELQAPERVVVIERASLPRKKDEMKRLRLIGAAVGGAFMFALFGVGFWEYRARRISSVDEVVNNLGMTIVGALPAMPERPRRRVGGPSSKSVEERWQKLLVESVDAMRTMLLHASRVESLRVIMVTSAGQGEGKTSLAGHLATSLARAGRNTLLVDCDIRRPTIHRLFDEPLDPGLCEMLRGDLSAMDAIRQGPTPDLSIVTAGRNDELAQQMLGQDRVRGFFEDWKQQFEFIIIDTPPVLPVADSLLLAPHVDGVLFAILREVSRVPQVQAAYERLARLGTRMLGAVVNGAQSDAQQYSSHYYIDQSVAD